jgi:peptidoglycan/xylan/chitin deacetylase (PgdA/CDA1 family)
LEENRMFKSVVKKAACLVIAFCFLLVGCDNAYNPEDLSVDTPPESTGDIPVNAEPETSPSETKKRVAMTFDDGPHNVRTREIVDELDKYGFTATFFVVGNRVDGGVYRGGETVKYIIDHGHEVGIHGYTHEVYYDRCTDDELMFEMSETAKAIKDQVKNYQLRLMRPVGGYITDQRVQTSQYSVIMWSVDSEDYKHAYFPNTKLSEAEQKECVDAIVENVMSNVKDGSIILMHDIYLSTSHATAIILELLHAEGYEVVSVSELLGNITPGTKYSSK